MIGVSPAAQRHDPPAQVYLGWIYVHGEGLAQDHADAKTAIKALNAILPPQRIVEAEQKLLRWQEKRNFRRSLPDPAQSL